jgi:predicted aldo/keto reductase-like oxidoreductase
MLFAMNHYGNYTENREGGIIPVAKKHGMGIMIMKSVRPKETVKTIDPSDLVRFALSLQGPTGVVVGMESRDVLEKNLALLRTFKPLAKEEMEKIASAVMPWFNSGKAPWLQPGYKDGIIA